MSKEHIIQFQAGQYRLTGTLHLPENPKPAVIIGCHGLQADRHSPKQIALARACSEVGMAYFRFDHRGCGYSQGDFSKVTSLDARCEDLFQAIDTLGRRDDLGPLIGLFGSSFGGTTVLKVASRHPVPALITYAAPMESRTIRDAAMKKEDLPPVFEHAPDFDISSCLSKVSHILVVHGRNDERVPVEHAEIIYQHANAPKDLIIQAGGDHRMSDPNHQRDFTRRFIQWFQNVPSRMVTKPNVNQER